MTFLKTAALAIPLALIFPLPSVSQDIEDIIDARQGYMEMLGINMGTLSGMAKGEIEYDEAVAVTAASNLAALGQYDLPSLFVEGSSSSDNGDSNALPAVWENSEGFAQRFAAFAEVTAASPAAVAGGQGNVGAAVQNLGGACKACHDDYRQRD